MPTVEIELIQYGRRIGKKVYSASDNMVTITDL